MRGSTREVLWADSYITGNLLIWGRTGDRTPPATTAFRGDLLPRQVSHCEEVAEKIEREVQFVGNPLLGTVPPIHWIFSDGTGETIVVEPDRDGLHVYRNTMGVMTNSPGYPWHRTNLLTYAGLRDLDYDTLHINGDSLEQCFSGAA